MKTCTTCQTDCVHDARFCASCGAPFSVIAENMEEDLIGTVIDGAYELNRRIGRGAMGAIYKAEQLSLGKEVAIKVLHRQLLKDASLTQRFHREARAASRIDHPNCITVMDFGQSETGLLYIAMEYIDGQDLAEVIYQDHPFSYGRLLHIIKQVCMALDEAHALGVIHRDLKPENIMLTNRRTDKDFVKVLDFGIAKIIDTKHKKGETFETVAGVVCGTPEYMSPEQARGQDLDARSDLYALGAILYQMLTGLLPFDGESPMEVVTRHLTEPVPDPSHIVPGIHPELVALTRQLLDKKRENRPDSAADVLQQVERLAELLGDNTVPIPVARDASDSRQRRMLESSETDMYPSADALAVPLSLDVSTPIPLDTGRMAPMPSPRQMQRIETEAAESPWAPRAERDPRQRLPSRTAWLSLTLSAVIAMCVGGYILFLSAQPTIGATGGMGEKIIVFEQLPGLPTPAAPSAATLPKNPTTLRTTPATRPSPTPVKPTVAAAAPTPPIMFVVPPIPEWPPTDSTQTTEKPSKPVAGPRKERPVQKKKAAARTPTPNTREKSASSPPPVDKAALRSILKRARQAKAAGQWDRVIASYQEAHRVQPSSRHLKEIGMAHVKRDNMNRACHYFRRYIKKLSSGRRGDAIERLAVFGCDLSM